MFLSLLLLLSRADDYKKELKHFYNPYCDEYPPNDQGTTIINEFVSGNGQHLRGCTNLNNVIFNLTTVPKYAFYASSLKTITLTAETKKIEKAAFAYCENLTTVTFNGAAEFSEIEEGAFYHSGLTTFTNNNFPNVSTINEYTFEGCPLTNFNLDFRNKNIRVIKERAFYSSGIKSIIFHPDTTNIGLRAFENCASLTFNAQSPEIKSKTISEYAFARCPGVTEITVTASDIKEGAFQCDPSRPTIINRIKQHTTTITVGDATETTINALHIYQYAFSGRTIKLSGVERYEDLTVDDFAFAYCSFSGTAAGQYGIHFDNDDKAITIGNSAFYATNLNSNNENPFLLLLNTTIGITIGYHCFELSQGSLKLAFRDVERPGSRSPVTFNDYAFYRSGLYNSKFDTESDFLILEGDTIGTKSFAECQSLKGAVYLKDSKFSNAEYSFYNCKNIQKIIIHNTDIPKGTFESCGTNIRNLTITYDIDLNSNTNDQINIGDRAFYASGLNCNLILHSFIDTIGEYAFAYCPNLVSHSITIYSNEIKPYAFSNCGKFTGPITIYSKDIQYHCFDENIIADMTIGKIIYENKNPSSTIHTEAFYDIEFTGLVRIDEHSTIDYNAFQMCRFGGNININATIGNWAFYNCSVTNPNVELSIGSTNVGSFAFYEFGQKFTFALKFHDKELASNEIQSNAFKYSNISGTVDIPWCFNSIGSNAFSYCTDITSVSINNSNIGSYAFFGSQKISSLKLYSHGSHGDTSPNPGMTTIGYYAFFNLENLDTDLIIPKYITSIGSHAFHNCRKIPRLVIESESALTYIGYGAFANCSVMTGEINITNKLENIDHYAFYNCQRLTKITFCNEDANLKQIGSYAFCSCTQLNGVLDIPDSVLYIGHFAFCNCSSFSHHLTINSDCSFGNYSFYGCPHIKRVEFNFPDEITDLTNLPSYPDKDLDGPDDYRFIGDFAFTGLPIYTNKETEYEFDIITLTIPSYFYWIGESAFENTSALKYLIINIDSSFNDYYTDIGHRVGLHDRSFYGSSITELSISSHNVYYYIGDYSFANSKLQLVGIGGGVYGNYVFANCQDLKGISISGGILGDYDFANCINLQPDPDENIILSMSGGTLGRHDFDGCTKFGGIVELSRYAIIGESSFEGFDYPFTLRAPYKSSNVQVHRRAFYNCPLVGDLDIRGVKKIESEAFANCRNSLSSLTIYPTDNAIGKNIFANTRFANETHSDGIVLLTVYTGSKINQYTFQDSRGFNRLKLLSASPNQIPYKAFYGMSNLQGELQIPGSQIGDYAFSGCGFHRIIFDSGSTIGEGAFMNCKNINETINFHSISKIPIRAFSGCSNLPLITFTFTTVTPQTTMAIFEKSAFEGCSSLNFDLSFPNNALSPPNNYVIGKYAFSGCSSLEGTNNHLKITRYVTEIGDYAFQNCAFERLEFSGFSATDKITLGVGAFAGCNKLSYEIDLPKMEDDRIPDRLFSGCTSIESIDFPTTTYLIGKYAFYNCRSIRGPFEIMSGVKRIEEYAFAGCSGFSGSLTINVVPSDDSQLIIGPHAFDGCKGFKDGELNILVEKDEESKAPYKNNAEAKNPNHVPIFRYKYFLRIGPKAFANTKFKNVYYNGRFQPDCDYDIGFSHTKGIHTSSNYLNKTFCSYPLHSNKLSGGAIAGITIAVIVVVAVIVFLIIFFILRNKKNKDKSEDEVEMNADP